MSRSAIKTLGITMGDPKGVGPEVIRKALNHPSIRRMANFVIAGDRKLLKGVPAAIIDIPYKTQGEGSLKFLQCGVNLIKEGIVDALVTAPLSKEAVSRYSKGFHGHTEYLAEAFGVKDFDMMFIGPNVRLTLATRHVPLKDVPKMITPALVYDCITLMHETLRTRFGMRQPRIAVLGLNPHAGENGLLGHEDKRQILPAIKKATAKGIKAFGPFPADTFFIKDKGFDGIIAMYHDQGLAPLKGMYFKELVNFTAGLPFVRTSPVHGTGYDIAGRNIADPSSMIASIKLAALLA